MKKEGIANEAYELIHNPPEGRDAGRILYDLYRELFKRKWDIKDLILFRKAVKVFGKKLVFFSIINLLTFDNINHSNIYKLIHYLCVREMKEERFEPKRDLSEYSDRMEKLKKRNFKIQENYTDDE